MAVYPATSLATQTNDQVAITGGTIAGTTYTQPSGRAGTVTLNGTTPVTISSASLAITDVIVLSLNTVGGTVGVQPNVKTIAAGQATIVATASDTSIMNWALIKTA